MHDCELSDWFARIHCQRMIDRHIDRHIDRQARIKNGRIDADSADVLRIAAR